MRRPLLVFARISSVASAIAAASLPGGKCRLVGDLAAWLPYTAPQSTWLTEALSLSDAGLGDVGRVALQLLGRGGPFGWGTMLHLVSLVVISLLYWSWLASWWARRQHESLELT